MIYKIVDRILQDEIRIDVRLGHMEKEARMVEGIRDSLENGRNVIMFVDTHRPTATIRTLNRKVLERFPDIPKQLIHIMEPTGVNDFHFRRFPVTTSLETIVRMREHILAS